nr:glycosyl transferase [Thioclava sp. F28-4]
MIYLVHDLDDAAIWRRVQMLRAGGAEVMLAGFQRSARPLPEPALILGHTANGKMAQRALSVLKALPGLAKQFPTLQETDVIIARNLEMLALGAVLKRRAPAARLVYELLDVHRLLSGNGPASKAIRAIEAAALKSASGLLYSSEGFKRGHPQPFEKLAPHLCLIENKPLALDPAQLRERVHPLEGPLQIGWNGILRCRWSLDTLDELTRSAPGHFRVTMRGRPALDQIPDFHERVAANPDLEFGGPYTAPDDLDEIYDAVDLAWLIDRYEAGENSDWLLPNRLYEGCLHGAIPVVLAGTEVARRTETLGIGVEVAEPSSTSVAQALSGLSHADIQRFRQAVAAKPRSTWEAGRAECRALVSWLADLPTLGAPRSDATHLREAQS